MEGQTEAPTTTPPAGQSRPSRAQVLAEMPFGGARSTDEKPASETTAAPAEVTDVDATDSDAKAAETPPPPAPPKDEAAVDESKVEKTDPDTDKRISAVQKAEKRSRETIAKERAEMKSEMQMEFDRQRAALTPHMESLKAFQTAKERAEVDPVGLLQSLGISTEKFDYIAQQIYNNSKAAETDPKRREFAVQAKEKRESESRLEAMQKRIDAMEAKERQQTEAAQNAKLEEAAFKSLSESVTDDAPLTKKLISKNPAKARTALLQTAQRLFEQTGEPPDADDVIAAYERTRAEELAELEIDVTTIGKTKVTVGGDEKRSTTGKTLDTSSSTTTKATPAKGKPSRDELIRDMPWPTSNG